MHWVEVLQLKTVTHLAHTTTPTTTPQYQPIFFVSEHDLNYSLLKGD